MIEIIEEKLVKIVQIESLMYVLKTYKLTEPFCAKYILFNDIYSKTEEEEFIDVEDVMKYQPHIDKIVLYRELDRAIEERVYYDY